MTPTSFSDLIGRLPALDVEQEDGAPTNFETDLATGEARAYANNDLKEESEKQEHGRNEKLKDHVHRAAVWAVWVGFISLLMLFVAVFWHYICPNSWAWQSDSQLQTLTAVLFSGAVTSGIGKYLSGRVK